jgi:hypothetical protein
MLWTVLDLINPTTTWVLFETEVLGDGGQIDIVYDSTII